MGKGDFCSLNVEDHLPPKDSMVSGVQRHQWCVERELFFPRGSIPLVSWHLGMPWREKGGQSKECLLFRA